MNELESFLKDINNINRKYEEKNTNENEINKLINDYIFNNQNTWSFITKLYKKQIKVNEIVFPKFLSLLIHTCGKLIKNSRLDVDNKRINDLYKLISTNNIEQFSDITLIPSKNGTIIDLTVICIHLFVDYYINKQTQLNDDNFNLINNLCSVIFDQQSSLLCVNLLKLIYLKYIYVYLMSVIKQINDNYESTKFYLEQFNIISNSLKQNDANNVIKTNFMCLNINYLFELSKYFSNLNANSIQQHSNSAYLVQITLFDQVYSFLFDNLMYLNDDGYCYLNKLNKIIYYFKKYKNFYQHTQSCLRIKHNNINCKFDVDQAQHSDLTRITENKYCLFERLFSKLMSINCDYDSDERVKVVYLKLLTNIGICSCISVDDLIDLIDSCNFICNITSINEIVYEFVLSKCNCNELNNEKCLSILLNFDKKSLILMNLLTATIRKLNKLTYHKQTTLIQLIIKLIDCLLNKYKEFEMSFVSQNQCYLNIFELVCKYLNQFLIILNHSLLNQTSTTSIDDLECQQQQEAAKNCSKTQTIINNLNSYVLNYFDLNTIKLCDSLKEKFELNFIEIMSIYSHLLLLNHTNNLSISLNQHHLCKLLIKLLKNKNNSDNEYFFKIINNENLLHILLNLYWKCEIFRYYLNKIDNFYPNLFKLLCDYFVSNDIDSINLNYLEILLNFILSYGSSNKKDLSSVYDLMVNEIDKNHQLLIVYLNVMILSKQFSSNKAMFFLSSSEKQETDQNGPHLQRLKSLNNLKQTDDFRFDRSFSLEYDADSELTIYEYSDEIDKTNSSYSYDLIIFPHIIEICMNFIIKKINNCYELTNFAQFALQYLKRIVYLLNTCNFNIQIIISNNYPHLFVDLLDKLSAMEDNVNNSLILDYSNYCFEVLYLISLFDIDKSLLYKLFEWIIKNKFTYNKSNSCVEKFNLCVNLFQKLTCNLQFFQTTTYLRFPYKQYGQNQYLEPINCLLMKTINSKQQQQQKQEEIEKSQVKQELQQHQKHLLAQMINYSPSKISAFNIPLKTQQASKHYSYSLLFTIRFDNDLIRFTTSYGLDNRHCTESYVHVLSQNLLCQSSHYEIWLNSNGNLLFIRRLNNSILFTVNIQQIKANVWNYIYISYDEQETTNLSILNCRIKYSINLKPIVNKEFEIYKTHVVAKQQPDKIDIQQQQQQQKELCENLTYLFVGHRDLNNHHLLNFDLGQIVLSEDKEYNIEHLVILMHLMDTSVSQIDEIINKKYNWTYLNGHLHMNIIENIEKYLVEYCEEIKNHVITIYQPRYQTKCAIIKKGQLQPGAGRAIERLAYQDIKCPCAPVKQTAFDIALAKIGGIRQMLMLVAHTITQDDSICEIVLETLLNLLNNKYNLNYEFKLFDGYSLLRRVFSSICLTKPTSIERYFKIILNNCFKEPLICVNKISFLLIKRSDSIFNEDQFKKQHTNLYLINVDLISNVLVEWKLLRFSSLCNEDKQKLLSYLFQSLELLLDDKNPSYSYHSTLFYEYKILDRLIDYLLDSNTSKFVFDDKLCELFVSIYKNFNCACCSFISKTKDLIANFNRYLNILHPEQNFYCVDIPKRFYYQMILNFNSNDEYSVRNRHSIDMTTSQLLLNTQLSHVSPVEEQEQLLEHQRSSSETTPSIEFQLYDDGDEAYSSPTKEQAAITASVLSASFQKPYEYMALDSLKSQENANNFSLISSHLMQIMSDMLGIIPNASINDIKIESFLILIKDDNEKKRLYSYKSFLVLLERQSTTVLNPLQKEYLIYSMCNQLYQYEQYDEKFIEFTIGALLNQSSFKFTQTQIDLKPLITTISARHQYSCLLISLLFSTRKNKKLCLNGLKFLMKLIEIDAIKIDYLIYRGGLLQVLFNLLIYFTVYYKNDANNLLFDDSNSNEDERLYEEIMSCFKQIYCLITRLILRISDLVDFNQKHDCFTYYLQMLIMFSYDSAGITLYEKLNYTLKSIVLNIIQNIMVGINTMTASQETNKPSQLLQKIIFPLLSSNSRDPTVNSYTSMMWSTQSATNNNSTILTTNLFDTDTKFQKFINFIIDYTFIINENTLNKRNYETTTYNLNDELSIFIFEILINAVSIGLGNSQKTKFSVLVKNNFNFIKVQFRRFLTFMMHPNHKLHTQLQLIKRLLNTTNCETILKCIFLLDYNTSQQNQPNSLNQKLKIYLNQLIDQKNQQQNTSTPVNFQLSNNDRELLIHLNETFLNIQNSIENTLNNQSIFSLNFTKSPTPPIQMPTVNIQSRQLQDLLIQFDKDYDTEILNIYKRANTTYRTFLNQFSLLTRNINEYAKELNQNAFEIYAKVQRYFCQNFKSKYMHSYEIKQKWLNMIENMTHEHCLWYDENSAPQFFVLDQTEGPNRERRRLRKTNLHIESRFFKDSVAHKLKNEAKQNKFDYLLRNEIESKSSSNKNSYDVIADSIAYIKKPEHMHEVLQCKHVMPYCEINGEIFLSDTHIGFVANIINFTSSTSIEAECAESCSWSYEDIKEIHKRRYLLKDLALELFLVFGKTYLLAFNDLKDREAVYKFIQNRIATNVNIFNENEVEKAMRLWKEGKLNNFQYLMQLNQLSGRTFNDLMQYPIYPHILSNYTQNVLDLAIHENFRELCKPIAIQNKDKEEKYLQNYKMLLEASEEPYHYASLYSNSGTVLHYLVRLPPFTKMFLDYQDQNFDVPDRTFHSLSTSWLLSSSESTTDFKELIPEFYFLHEFLTNKQDFNLGVRQNGEPIDNVLLAPWCNNNPRLFVLIMRQAIESEYVSLNLNNWIDLIFGYKQNGKMAFDSINCYHPACYFGYPVEQINDTVHRKAIETMIKTWGQTPKQLFSMAHPQLPIQLAQQKKTFYINSTLPDESIHRKILNTRWGTYVGSLDQPMPSCVWHQRYAKPYSKLVGLSSAAFLINQCECLAILKSKDYQGDFSEKVYINLIKWGFTDDFFYLKESAEKPLVKLLAIRANEHSITCCTCIGSKYLVIGESSGLISVYEIKKEKNQLSIDSFYSYLFGHKDEISDIYVCMSYSTMATCSIDGLLIIWDTNRLNYVSSIRVNDVDIYRVCISETTNEIAFISSKLNKLYFYTGNCEFIGEKSMEEDIKMKSLCFSNAPEGANINVIAVGLSNGYIHLFSTWDLTLLRKISVHAQTEPVAAIISLTYTQDLKRLFALDSNSAIYILESINTYALTTPAGSLFDYE